MLIRECLRNYEQTMLRWLDTYGNAITSGGLQTAMHFLQSGLNKVVLQLLFRQHTINTYFTCQQNVYTPQGANLTSCFSVSICLKVMLKWHLQPILLPLMSLFKP